MAEKADEVQEVFTDAPGVARGNESNRDNKRQRGDSNDCGSASEDDREKMKKELLEEMRKIMREEMKEVMKEVMREEMREAVREEIKPVIEMISELKKKVSSVEEQMRKQTEEVMSVKSEVNVVKDEMCVWKKRVEKIEDSLIDQRARSMRNNLMFYGVAEGGKTEDCKKIVKDMIVDKCGVSGAVRLERVHRIPTGERPASSTRPRPIICKFLDYNEKMEVKKNAKQLPNGVKVGDDLPREIRDARKALVPDLKKAWEAGKDAFVAFPARLIVNKVEVKAIRPGSVAPDGRQRTPDSA